MPEINTQPLMTNQHLTEKYNTPRKMITHEREWYRPWNPEAMGLDLNTWFNAYLIGNHYGYSFDRILEYLIAQIPINDTKLEFNLDPHHTLRDKRDPKIIQAEFKRWGKKPHTTKATWNQIMGIEQGAGICYVPEFLNAVAYQFINNPDHHILLEISQEKEFQEYWNRLKDNSVTGDFSKIPLGSAHFQDGNLVLQNGENNESKR